MPMLPSWQAYSKIGSADFFKGTVAGQGRAQMVGSLKVTSYSIPSEATRVNRSITRRCSAAPRKLLFGE